MNRQQMFDAATRHVFNQGRQARDELGTHCVYKSEDGRLKCAVGALIPSGYYVLLMEGLGIYSLMKGFGHAIPKWLSDNRDLLYYLQHAHDTKRYWFSPDTLRKAFIRAALNNGLDPSVAETHPINTLAGGFEVVI
jgi:hypothetical protein